MVADFGVAAGSLVRAPAGAAKVTVAMSIADLMSAMLDGGMTSLAVIGLWPVAIGSICLLLSSQRKVAASQFVANLGIAVGLMSLLLLMCSMIWGWTNGMSMISDVPVLWLLAPFYLLGAGFLLEHRIHPGKQEGIRGKIRGALLIVIVLTVIFWVLARMRIWMMVHTGITGMLLFIAAMIGILYYLVRKAI